MADIVLEITIPEDKSQRVLDAILYNMPKADGHTNKSWIEKIFKNYLIKHIREYERKVACENIIISEDFI